MRDGESGISIFPKEGAIVSNLVSWGQVVIDLHVSFTQAYFSWGIYVSLLGWQASIQGRNAITVLLKEFLVAEAGQ
jgi:hypothetical protein